VKEGIKVEKIKPPKIDLDEGEEEEEEEDIEVKEKTIEKEAVLGSISMDAHAAVKENGRWKTKLELQFVVNLNGSVEVAVWEAEKGSDKVSVSLSAP
jgi:heat shock 70kDa protein 1/2/6/8